MGQSLENSHRDNMHGQVISLSLLAVATAAAGQEAAHNLPVLFQYSEPGHSVAVFRGAQLRQAIAAGLVPGFGNLGNRAGKKIDSGSGDMAATDARTAANARAAADARARAASAKAADDARSASDAKAAADARARAAAAKAAADARAAASRPSQLDLAEQACVQACKN